MTPVYYGPNSYPVENEKVGNFVSELIWGKPGLFEKFCTMGVYRDGELVAGVVYHNWQDSEGVVEISSASKTPRWATRPVLRAMFRLAFDVLRVRVLVMRISEHDKRMRSISKRLGFSETVIPLIRGDNEAECVQVMHVRDWRNNRLNG